MFKRILKTVLNVILFLSLVILSYLTIIRGVFLEEVEAKTNFDSSKIRALRNYDKDDLHKIFDNILRENEIPTNLIDEILDNENSKMVIDDYLNEVIASSENKRSLPEIPKEKIETIIITSIENYNQNHQENISIAKVKKLVSDVSRKGEVVLNFVNQNIKIISGIRFIFNDTVYYSFLIITLILIIMIAILFKKEAIFSLGGISIFNGITLLITHFILKIPSLQNILEFLPMNLQSLKKTFLISSITFILTGVMLFVLYRILLIHQEKKKIRKIV